MLLAKILRRQRRRVRSVRSVGDFFTASSWSPVIFDPSSIFFHDRPQGENPKTLGGIKRWGGEVYRPNASSLDLCPLCICDFGFFPKKLTNLDGLEDHLNLFCWSTTRYMVMVWYLIWRHKISTEQHEPAAEAKLRIGIQIPTLLQARFFTPNQNVEGNCDVDISAYCSRKQSLYSW